MVSAVGVAMIFFGFKYWGGIQGDVQEKLVDQGYTVLTASIGSFSSNWDRACELYAQIKGGQVDYGAKHSETHGHSRFGRNYSALYPEWGEANADGSVNKIHLVGHSMGGQTVRMLAQMLEKGATGAPTEEDAISHPLFEGGKSWVHSVTTIASPNQGTTLADGFSVIGDGVKNALVTMLSVIGIAGDTTKAVFDAQLDHWNIYARATDESIKEYYDRILSSRLFDPSFKDTCLWSLSVAGAKEESVWVETLSDIYYFSYATVGTFAAVNWKFKKIQLPNPLTMNPAFDVLSVFLGSRYAPDKLNLTTDWQPNDGVVNTMSMSHDGLGELMPYSGLSEIGKWNQMEVLTGFDHMDVTGFSLFSKIIDIYSSLAQLLASLPVNGEARSSVYNKEVHTTVTGPYMNGVEVWKKRLQKRIGHPVRGICSAVVPASA
ncbi:hypothetical protein BBO99_00006339 [Phytophthora kernoviae]|uniref:Lipase-like C-terminal domain-containing protein n=2 Tax=Phytophthora kernoviae TaxID=325452 RepID=A0A3R7JQB4_9STRA|nr:hypothetical protein G195_007334 [Phytophthora kernoviae 00238/432]KAG2522915.1 hypothetical protein JM16_004254 [Phytophthora kernoviae]RLM95382.1 hypothetical protein BBI17_006504 [Phytophthora kernoviae]RLN77939.1 hypothetical protein BBO99_00006339 [Phytophthora kernoviae]